MRAGLSRVGIALLLMAGARLPGAVVGQAWSPPRAPMWPAGQVSLADFLMEHDREVALARSAAPPPVGEAATVMVLEETGYAVKTTGTNGFTCLVERRYGNPEVRAPQCFDPEAAATVMPVILLRAELAADGWTGASIDAEIARRFGSGELRAPRRTAIGYMLSSEARALEPIQTLTPHLMIYAPYLKNEDIGVIGPPLWSMQGAMFEGEGGPHATLVIVMSEAVEPRYP